MLFILHIGLTKTEHIIFCFKCILNICAHIVNSNEFREEPRNYLMQGKLASA